VITKSESERSRDAIFFCGNLVYNAEVSLISLDNNTGIPIENVVASVDPGKVASQTPDTLELRATTVIVDPSDAIADTLLKVSALPPFLISNNTTYLNSSKKFTWAGYCTTTH
jgi:hypothetical protein